MTAKNLSEQFAAAAAWNAVLLPARLVVGLVATVVYYQVLGREEVGLVFFLTSLATTIGLYADLGIERSLPRFLPEVERDYGRRGVVALLGRVIGVKLAVLALLIGVLLALATPLSRELAGRQRTTAALIDAQVEKGGGRQDTTKSLRQRADSARAVADLVASRGVVLACAVATLLVLGALFDVAMQFLAAYFKQKAWNLITLVTTLLQPILVTGLVLSGAGVPGVLLGLILTPTVSLVIAAIQVRRATRDLATAVEARPIPPTVWRRLARFAAMNYLIQVTTWLYDVEFVVFLCAGLLGLSEVAVLGFAYKLTKDLLGYIWTPLNGVMTPLLARIKGRDSLAALRDANASLTRLILLLLVPAATGFGVLAPRLVASLYPKYTAAVPLILVLIAFAFAEAIMSVSHNTLMVHEIYRPVIASRLVPVLCLPLMAILVPRFGTMGVALVVGLARVCSRLVTVWAGYRRLGLAFPAAFALRAAAASAAFATILAALLGLFPSPGTADDLTPRVGALAPLVALSILGAALYAVALRAMGGLHADERRRILALPLPLKGVLRHVL